MPQHVAKAPWSDLEEKNFAIKIIEGMGANIPVSVFAKIAEEMGPPHNASSLSQRYGRMKKKVMSQIENGEAPLKKGGRGKRAAADREDAGEGGKPGKKAKKSKYDGDEDVKQEEQAEDEKSV